jgi:RimJ/RimL family protein N-acetyltransferase
MPGHLPRPPEILETGRLTLRPLVESDATGVFTYANDQEATRFMNFARHLSLSESSDWVRRCFECWRDGTAFPWAMVVKDKSATGDFIGVIELRVYPPIADFGFILHRRAWGHGYASEATTAVVAWAITQSRINRVWATCHPDNVKSARVLEKAGLRFAGRLENWEPRPNLGEHSGPSLAYVLIRPSDFA